MKENDYTSLNNYILEKYPVNIIEINKKAKEYFNNKSEYTKVIDNLVCKMEVKETNKEHNTFFISSKDIDNYFDKVFEELGKELKKYITMEIQMTFTILPKKDKIQ